MVSPPNLWEKAAVPPPSASCMGFRVVPSSPSWKCWGWGLCISAWGERAKGSVVEQAASPVKEKGVQDRGRQGLKRPVRPCGWAAYPAVCLCYVPGPKLPGVDQGLTLNTSQGSLPAGCAEVSQKPLSGCQLTSIPEAEGCSRSQRSPLQRQRARATSRSGDVGRMSKL